VGLQRCKKNESVFCAVAIEIQIIFCAVGVFKLFILLRLPVRPKQCQVIYFVLKCQFKSRPFDVCTVVNRVTDNVFSAWRCGGFLALKFNSITDVEPCTNVS